jgi:hypothetical protein
VGAGAEEAEEFAAPDGETVEAPEAVVLDEAGDSAARLAERKCHARNNRSKETTADIRMARRFRITVLF